jgi:hypothetical protein
VANGNRLKLPDFLIRCGECTHPLKPDEDLNLSCRNEHCPQCGQRWKLHEGKFTVAPVLDEAA